MKDKKNWFLLIVCILSLAVIGCQSMLDEFTPCIIGKQPQTYLGVADPNRCIVSLATAKEMLSDIDILHHVKQQTLLRQAQDDNYGHSLAYSYISASVKMSEQFQAVVVGAEDQPFSLLGVLAGFTGGAAIFNMRKRKGDYSPEEAELEMETAYQTGLEDGKNGK